MNTFKLVRQSLEGRCNYHGWNLARSSAGEQIWIPFGLTSQIFEKKFYLKNIQT